MLLSLSLSSLVIVIVVKTAFFSGQKWDAFLDINTVGKKENYPIDLVYLWCEDNSKREQQRNELKEKFGNKKGINSFQTTNKGRFIDNNELKYSLRSVEKYAPWINKIYIVTDNQVPKWLNLKHPKVKIVDHRELMPQCAIPNFNSAAIEQYISNIPNLSEHFIYANDDIMFGRQVEPGDFFKNGKPIYILRSVLAKKNLRYEDDVYIQHLLNAKNLIEEKFGKKFKVRKPKHVIFAFTKTIFNECRKCFSNEIKNAACQQLRSATGLNTFIYVLYSIVNDLGYYKIEKKKYYNWKSILSKKYKEISLYTRLHDIYTLRETLYRKKPKLFCINDTEHTYPYDREVFHLIMEEIFPDKSAFEK